MRAGAPDCEHDGQAGAGVSSNKAQHSRELTAALASMPANGRRVTLNCMLSRGAKILPAMPIACVAVIGKKVCLICVTLYF